MSSTHPFFVERLPSICHVERSRDISRPLGRLAKPKYLLRRFKRSLHSLRSVEMTRGGGVFGRDDKGEECSLGFVAWLCQELALGQKPQPLSLLRLDCGFHHHYRRRWCHRRCCHRSAKNRHRYLRPPSGGMSRC